MGGGPIPSTAVQMPHHVLLAYGCLDDLALSRRRGNEKEERHRRHEARMTHDDDTMIKRQRGLASHKAELGANMIVAVKMGLGKLLTGRKDT